MPGSFRPKPLIGPLVANSASWFSARAPFVWRTQLLVRMAMGVAASGLAFAYGAYRTATPVALPGWGEVEAELAWAVVFSLAAATGVGVSILYATPIVLRWQHHLAVFACTASSVVGIALAPAAFLAAFAPRVAALETPETMAMHAANRFWQCWTDREALERAIDAHLTDSVVSKYGAIVPRSRGTTYFWRSEEQAEGCLATAGAERRTFYAVRLQDAPALALSERLALIDASQHYVAGDRGWSDLFSVRMAVAFSLGLAALVTYLLSAYTPRLALPAWLTQPRLKGLARLDSTLARLSPVLWASQLHTNGPAVALAPATFTLLALGIDLWSPTAVMALLTVGVSGVFWAMRTQEQQRHLGLSWVRETGVFVMLCGGIAAVCVATSFTGPLLPGLAPFENWRDVSAGVTFGAMFLAVAMIAARNTSMLSAFGGLIGFAIFLVGGVLGLERFQRGPDFELPIAWILASSLSALLYVAARRFELRLSVRRLAFGGLMIAMLAPTFVSWRFVMVPATQFSWQRLSVLIAGTVASVSLFLFLTRHSRNADSYSIR